MPCLRLIFLSQARRAFLKVLSNGSNGSANCHLDPGHPRPRSKAQRRPGGPGAGASNGADICSSSMAEVFETEPLQSDSSQFKQVRVRADCEQCEQLEHPQEIDRQWSNHQRDSRCVREKIQMAYERVDRVAMYLFPAIFFMFNLLYWTYYLIIVNMFDFSLFWTPEPGEWACFEDQMTQLSTTFCLPI